MQDAGYQIKDFSLRIYDVSGRLIKECVLFPTISWDGTDLTGCKVPAGVYFYHLEIDKQQVVGKIVRI